MIKGYLLPNQLAPLNLDQDCCMQTSMSVELHTNQISFSNRSKFILKRNSKQARSCDHTLHTLGRERLGSALRQASQACKEPLCTQV